MASRFTEFFCFCFLFFFYFFVSASPARFVEHQSGEQPMISRALSVPAKDSLFFSFFFFFFFFSFFCHANVCDAAAAFLNFSATRKRPEVCSLSVCVCVCAHAPLRASTQGFHPLNAHTPLPRSRYRKFANARPHPVGRSQLPTEIVLRIVGRSTSCPTPFLTPHTPSLLGRDLLNLVPSTSSSP